jgi:hypothetical protein
MSEKQTEANRINGAKGGPKTPEGIEICKMNALRHSLTAQKVLLNSESQPEFEAMLAGYNALLKPLGLEEVDLIREVVTGKWRQERWWQIEAHIIDLAVDASDGEIKEAFNSIDESAKAAFALAKQHGYMKALNLVSLYEGRMRRLHERARRDLDRLQLARIPKPGKFAPPPPEPEPVQQEPTSYLSYLSEEEKIRVNGRKNGPNLDLPFDYPELDSDLPGTGRHENRRNKEPKRPNAA